MSRKSTKAKAVLADEVNDKPLKKATILVTLRAQARRTLAELERATRKD